MGAGGDLLLASKKAAAGPSGILGRFGRPEEIAAMVGFLASDDAAFATGETIGVSGGMGLGG